jgi:ribonuclease HI
MLISPNGDRLFYVIQLYLCATNNVVEYKALVNGLRITAEHVILRLYIREDYHLIVNQVMGESNCRDSHVAAYRQEIKKLEEQFDSSELHHIL